MVWRRGKREGEGVRERRGNGREDKGVWEGKEEGREQRGSRRREGGRARRKKVRVSMERGGQRGGGREKSPGPLYTTCTVVEDAGHTIIIQQCSKDSTRDVCRCDSNPYRPSAHYPYC